MKLGGECVMSRFETSPSVSRILAAPEFQSRDPVQGHEHPGAQGENGLPGSGGACSGQPQGGRGAGERGLV